jgi:hypothetical protein
MKKITSLQVALLPTADLTVGETTYKLCFDMNAIAKGNEVLKTDLTKIANWQTLTIADLSVVAWAALDQFHPAVELRTVKQWFGAVQKSDLLDLLMQACFPNLVELVEAYEKEQARKAQVGGDQPNLPAEAK